MRNFSILTINENQILEHAGRISHELALEIANSEFDKYHALRQQAEDVKALEDLGEEIKKLKK